MSTTKETVAAMAYSTGARLKSSAVELFRGLESSFQNREQFDVALAKMFGSCTGDFSGQNNNTNNNRDGGLPSRSASSLSYSDNNNNRATAPRQTLGAAPLRRETSNSSSRRQKTTGTRASSSASRQKRNSGGANNNNNNSAAASVSSSSSSSSRGSQPERRRERRQTRPDYGEHIYAQLFMDDQKRAEQAVNTLRETAVARGPPAATSDPRQQSPSQQSKQQQPPSASKPFPVSSPPRDEPKIAPLSSNEFHIPTTLTFDDGISAISQHTLEAMEDRLNRTRSSESSLFSSLKETTKASVPPPLPPTRKPGPTLQMLPRVRSAQTQTSKVSRKSHTSQTTHTSDTSSFHNIWQQEEQRYWNTQVEHDSRKSRKSRNESVEKTVSTSMESSFEDVWGSPLRHPHDASPLARDPDRIGAVFVVPHTEMAEI